MLTCSVLIPIAYEEEIFWLEANLESIKKYKNKDLSIEVIIGDQTGNGRVPELCKAYSAKHFVCPRIDAGTPIQEGLKYAEGQYYTSLDIDCVPIRDNWLSMPVKMVKEFDLSMYGKATGLHLHPDYNKWGKHYNINNYFRTMLTEKAKIVAEDVGFMRSENRYKSNFTPKNAIPFEPNNDNGCAANHYIDVGPKEFGPKISMAFDRNLGMTPEYGCFGMVLESSVFHMVFSSSQNWIYDRQKSLGADYLHWYNRIKNEGFLNVWPDIDAALKDQYSVLTDREISYRGESRRLTPQDAEFVRMSELKNEQ